MAQVLQEFTLELVVDTEVPLAADTTATREEVDSAAKLVARGGIEGAVLAVNQSMPAGYYLRPQARA
jgi:hypothetical protein